MELLKTENGYSVFVNDKTYIFENATLSKVLVGKKNILNGPVRLAVNESGEEVKNFRSHCICAIKREKEIVITATMESNFMIFSTVYTIEDDGFIKADLSVSMCGYSVAEVFGLEKTFCADDFKLNKLWLEIPYKKEVAKYFNMSPKSNYHWADGTENKDPFGDQNEIIGGIYAPFRFEVNIHDGKDGLCFYCESDEPFRVKSEDRVTEILPSENECVLRIHFLDSHPESWKQIGNMDIRQTNDTLRFNYALQATPIKKLSGNRFGPHIFHIDCFVKIKEDYLDFLMNYKDENGGNGFDRLKRLGVETLVIHEKWNNIQNYWELTEFTKNQAERIIEECHKRGIKVVPYFGYEISTLSPIYADGGYKYLRDHVGFAWYRQPPQRDYPVCYNSDFADIWFNGVTEIVDKMGFDGIYLDGTACACKCNEKSHGCGYERDGKRRFTYPVYATRNLIKRLYEHFHPQGKTVDCHVSIDMNMSALGYSDILYTGEHVQSLLLNKHITTIPKPHMLAAYRSENLGLAIQFVSYNNEDTWTFEKAMTLSLLHGVMPRPNNINEPLEIASRVWKIFDGFDTENSVFVPYSENETYKCENENVLISYFDGGKEKLIVAGALSKTGNAPQNIDFGNVTVVDAETNKVISEDGKVTLNLKEFERKLLKTETK